MRRKILVYLVSLQLIGGCKIDRKEVVDRDRFTFKATEDSYLFFKNVRQIYYDFTDLPQARWHAYRYGDRYKGNERPMLTPVIVVAWIKNEAYLLIEPNELLQAEEMLIIHEIANGKTYEYRLGERGRENMLEFATKIYEGIMAENEILIRVNDQYERLFTNEEDAENFRVVMGDYYRLTRIF